MIYSLKQFCVLYYIRSSSAACGFDFSMTLLSIIIVDIKGAISIGSADATWIPLALTTVVALHLAPSSIRATTLFEPPPPTKRIV